MVKDYTRKITHKDYKNPEKLKKYYHRVIKQIYFSPKQYKNSLKKSEHKLVNNIFIVSKVPEIITPIIFGGGAFAFMLAFLLPLDKERSDTDLVFLIITALITLFFLIYGFTMPKKEYILNRKDGLITFPGFYWQPSITMIFDKIEFSYSTGGDNAIGAFMLQIIRPTKGQTFEYFHITGIECYEEMSFITWYMDKNRPLPLYDVFDPYREQDYQRRKAEGFPKPLYPSVIDTPEATAEQQAERKRIGGW